MFIVSSFGFRVDGTWSALGRPSRQPTVGPRTTPQTAPRTSRRPPHTYVDPTGVPPPAHLPHTKPSNTDDADDDDDDDDDDDET